MKILHISNGDDILGSAKCLQELLKYEKKINVESVLLTPSHNKLNDFCDDNGIENYSVSFNGFMYPKHDRYALFKYNLRKIQYLLNRDTSIQNIEKNIDVNSFNLIHTNTCTQDIGLKLSIKYNIPHIWHLREGGLKQQNLVPYIHDLSKYMLDNNTYYIAVSNSVKEEWTKIELPENRIKVIYDGIDIPRKYLFNKSVSSNLARFVLVGSYSEIKGQIQVIRAISLLSKEYKEKLIVDFWGVGTKKYTRMLVKEVNKHDLSSIINLRGFSDSILENLPYYNVGFNCTRIEAFGRSTVEYLVSGIPVIASNLGANIEIINDSNGVFYEYNNIEDLKNKIMYMIDNHYNYNNYDISNQASKLYSSDVCNKNIMKHFRSIVEENDK